MLRSSTRPTSDDGSICGSAPQALQWRLHVSRRRQCTAKRWQQGGQRGGVRNVLDRLKVVLQVCLRVLAAGRKDREGQVSTAGQQRLMWRQVGGGPAGPQMVCPGGRFKAKTAAAYQPLSSHLLRGAGCAPWVDQDARGLPALAGSLPRAGGLLSRTSAPAAAAGPILGLVRIPPFVHGIGCCRAHGTGCSQPQQPSPVSAAAAGSGGSGLAASPGTQRRSHRARLLLHTFASSPACRRRPQSAARGCRLGQC